VKNATPSPDGKTITVHIPMTLTRRGARKLIIGPEGADGCKPTRAAPDKTLIKAVARAHRWKRMLDDGIYASIAQLAEGEKVAEGYVGRLLRLTLLAPDIVERILDGRQLEGMGLSEFLRPWPVLWEEQRGRLKGYSP